MLNAWIIDRRIRQFCLSHVFSRTLEQQLHWLCLWCLLNRVISLLSQYVEIYYVNVGLLFLCHSIVTLHHCPNTLYHTSIAYVPITTEAVSHQKSTSSMYSSLLQLPRFFLLRAVSSPIECTPCLDQKNKVREILRNELAKVIILVLNYDDQPDKLVYTLCQFLLFLHL